MSLEQIVLLGDHRLRRVSRPADWRSPNHACAGARLKTTLAEFRTRHGFGRAIAAPQLGYELRLVACHLSSGDLAAPEAFLMLNPAITWRSTETFTLWDDCISFPDLLVRVRRHCSISLRFTDESGRIRIVERLDASTSELLQHEVDHLDGRLAVDLALDGNSVINRSDFDSDPSHFGGLVDGPIETQASPE